MNNLGFKAFICSFGVSMLAIMAVQGTFFAPPKNHTKNLKIPEKNLSLFLKNEDILPIKAQVVPVQKIALNTLAKAPQNVSDTVDIDELVAQNQTFSNPLKDGFDNKTLVTAQNIPLEIMAEEPLPETIVALNKATAVEAPAQSKSPSPPEVFSEKKTTPQPEQLVAQAEEPVTFVLADSFKEPEVQIAQNETNFSLPIPLESNDAFEQNAVVKTAENAETVQVALAKADVPIKSFANEQNLLTPKANEPPLTEEWHPMESKPTTWAVAKGNAHAKNKMSQEEPYAQKDAAEIAEILNEKLADTSSQEVELAAKTTQNLLIPIPQEILDEENLTPQLVEEKNTKAEKKATSLHKQKQAEEPQDSGGLLKNLSNIFNSTSDVLGKIDTKISSKVEAVKNKVAAPEPVYYKILPTEIRLSFQPNRVEISGQTLKWLEAFAQKARENPRIILEIRINGTSSFELQQKRLNLLQNILINKGTEPSKLNTVFTNREPNSFVIRTLTLKEEPVEQEIRRVQGNTANQYLAW